MLIANRSLLINTPLFTIITVVLNAKKDLETTLKSVQDQSFEDYEYIVVDGGSIDGSLNLIKGAQVSTWISEPDKGLYDAMNKGVKIATGQWILFMNAGDVFYDNTILSRLADQLNKNNKMDVIYGDTEIIYMSGFKRLSRANQENRNLWQGMNFCHQSTFVTRSILMSYPFNLEYKYGADFNLFLTLKREEFRFCHVPFSISRVINNGLADLNRIAVIKEWEKIARKVYVDRPFVSLYIFGFYRITLAITLFKELLKRALPKKAVDKIIRLLHP